jgi:hypothetical protein
MSADPWTPEWLEGKGIDPDVWDARGCKRYERGDAWVKEMIRPYVRVSKHQPPVWRDGKWRARTRPKLNINLPTIDKVVSECGGWVMPKHHIPGTEPMPPQLRPDVEVILDPRPIWHFHSSASYVSPWPTFPPEAGVKLAGRGLPVDRVMLGREGAAHVARDRGGEPYDPETGTGEHKGVPVDKVHPHAPSVAKYLLLGDREDTVRIDLHPVALERLSQVEAVFAVLEGGPKTDAILSTGACAFGVPSVTCWDADELLAFAHEYLRDKAILIVPDADWYEKDEVARQATRVRTLLRRRGFKWSYVVAPPYDAADYHKGIDDYLGAGYSLDHLMVEGRQPQRERIREAVSKIIPYQRRDSAYFALEDMSLYADADGRLDMSFPSLKKLLGVSKSHRLVPLLESLEHTFTIERGSLETELRPRFFGRYKDTVWVDQPTITLDEYYRADERREQLLTADFWQRRFQSHEQRLDDLERWRAEQEKSQPEV